MFVIGTIIAHCKKLSLVEEANKIRIAWMGVRKREVLRALGGQSEQKE